MLSKNQGEIIKWDVKKQFIYWEPGFPFQPDCPPQSAILKKIFENAEDFLEDFLTENETLLSTEKAFENARLNIAQFLIRMFSANSEVDILNELTTKINAFISSNEEPKDTLETVKQLLINNELINYVAKNLSYVSLEDIFTIIDKAILTGENVHNYKTEDLYRLREDLVVCILRIFSKISLKHSFDNQTYQTFVNHLIDIRLKEPEEDSLAVITLNWDSILDAYLSRTIEALGNTKAKIDYCIYDYDYECCYIDPTKEWCPSTQLKNSGFINIKLLKLHGALNWLTCVNCHRLFYAYEENIGIRQFFQNPNNAKCRYCENCYNTSIVKEPQISLKCQLATPTMLKNFDDVNLRNIWKCAFIELSEANKIIFIGYSFPQADYEFRYLLKRALNPQAKVEVVLAPNDNPNYYYEIQNPDIINRIHESLPTNRYNAFFGKDENKIKFYYEGLEGYMKLLS
jgi:NAD-dependent SIR2 family protein deacetylase